MRFLIDNNLPPRMAEALIAAGHDAVHVRERGLAKADDAVIFDAAAAANRCLISQDTDFATLLATRRQGSPSVIIFRQRQKSLDSLLPVLLGNLEQLSDDLETGSVVVFEDARLRIRRLPIA